MTSANVDIVTFIHDVLVNPETGKPFELYPAQEQFFREAFRLTPDGRLLYPDAIYGAIKKSGKTTVAGIAVNYVGAVLAPRYGEIIIGANDLEQSQGRIFQAAARIAEASPMLRSETRVTAQRIEYKRTNSVALAVANDYRGIAGVDPTWIFIDEPWAAIAEAARRFLEELARSPARLISGRMLTSYAGYLGESTWLWDLYQRGLQGEEFAPSLYRQPGLLMAWHHEPVAPWQTREWLEQERQSVRPNTFLRMYENRWVDTESGFVDMVAWDACIDPQARPVVADRSLGIDVGIDASLKHDATAIVWATWDRARNAARLIGHRIFQPSPDNPLDFERTIEATVLELRDRFRVRSVRFDPYQMVASAQRLTRAGLPMIEFPQTAGNLTEASNNLRELIIGRNLIVYPGADDIRLAVSRAVAIEGVRGWRIGKEKSAHRIDVVVAMAQAALGAALSQRPTGGGEATVVLGTGCSPSASWRPAPIPPYRHGDGPRQLPAHQRRTR